MRVELAQGRWVYHTQDDEPVEVCQHCGLVLVRDAIRGWVTPLNRARGIWRFGKSCAKNPAGGAAGHEPFDLHDAEVLEEWLNA